VRLSANAEVDLLNQGELEKTLRNPDVIADYWGARGRAEKYLEQLFNFGAAGGAVSAAAGLVLTDNAGNGSPRPGYAWGLRTVCVLTTAPGQISIWKIGDQTQANAAAYVKGLGQDTVATKTAHTFNLSGFQGILRAGEFVAVNALAALTVTAAWFAVAEVPEAELWKIE
jgi:hypothetical protein